MDDSVAVGGCKLIDLPATRDHRGLLTVAEASSPVPFGIRRLYCISEVPKGEKRGGHAHRDLEELVIAIRGSFDVVISDGSSSQTITMNRPDQALYIPPLVWHELVNFSSDAIVLGVASTEYDSDDYYRNYESFLETVCRADSDSTVP
jgi:dTDP-4-dehydrorhamnose 3,5-epimerase-like enzyme